MASENRRNEHAARRSHHRRSVWRHHSPHMAWHSVTRQPASASSRSSCSRAYSVQWRRIAPPIALERRHADEHATGFLPVSPHREPPLAVGDVLEHVREDDDVESPLRTRERDVAHLEGAGRLAPPRRPPPSAKSRRCVASSRCRAPSPRSWPRSTPPTPRRRCPNRSRARPCRSARRTSRGSGACGAWGAARHPARETGRWRPRRVARRARSRGPSRTAPEPRREAAWPARGCFD